MNIYYQDDRHTTHAEALEWALDQTKETEQ